MKLSRIAVLTLGVLIGVQGAHADPWKIEVAPYLWAINMKGRVQVGPVTTHINEDFSDILSQFHGGGMLWLNAQKDRTGIFLNTMYSVLEQSKNVGPRHSIKVSSKNNFGIFSAGASYALFQHPLHQPGSMLTLEPYIGARYTLNDVTIKILGLSFKNNKNWTDPIIGARVKYDVNTFWQGIVAGDIGGTSFKKQKSYNVQGFLGYKPASLKNTTVYAGYRLLYQHYVTGSGLKRFDWTMKLFGPVIGASILF